MNGKWIYFLYRFAFAPLILILLPFLTLLNAKIRTGWKLRRGKPWLKQKLESRPIWIHCSSGEIEYAKPVIREIKNRNPQAKILVTYFSPSSKKNIESFPGIDFATPTPWETAASWREFIGFHQPQRLLIARTDFWPEMLVQAEKAGIPILLFSATLTPESGRMNSLVRPFYSWLAQKLTTVFCVSEKDVESFRLLGLDRARVEGDTRFDQVFTRLENPKSLKRELFTGKNRNDIFVIGSSWPEDEAVLLPAIQKIKAKYPNFRVVLAPHEPTPAHLNSLIHQLDEIKLSHAFYSKAVVWNEDVLLIDQVGILAELYTQGAFAFVGGSFRKTVHSVMEPLAAGCMVFLGPKHLNNREAVEFQNQTVNGHPIIRSCENAAQMAAGILQLQGGQVTELSALVREKVAVKRGGTEAVLEWIAKN